MTEIISLDKNYSTTCNVIKVKSQDVLKKITQDNKEKDKFKSIMFIPKAKGMIKEGGLRSHGYFKKSYDNKPLISIITVVHNGARHIEETIQSVINQDYDNVEYIIIDGDSTDGTIDIIKKYDDMIDYWVSESDNGIYDAMNKGISLCTGAIIGIINADDYYLKDSFSVVINELNNPNTDILYSDFYFLDRDKFFSKKANHNLLNIKMSVFHPSVFMKKKMYKEYGCFDCNLKISADYKLIYNLYRRNLKFKKTSSLLTAMRLGGVSTNSRLAIEETFDIQKTNSIVLAYLFKYLRLLKRILI